jgi:hypothetical protein
MRGQTTAFPILEKRPRAALTGAKTFRFLWTLEPPVWERVAALCLSFKSFGIFTLQSEVSKNMSINNTPYRPRRRNKNPLSRRLILSFLSYVYPFLEMWGGILGFIVGLIIGWLSDYDNAWKIGAIIGAVTGLLIRIIVKIVIKILNV